MHQFVSQDQLRITTHASGFFRQLIENAQVVPMFRQAGEGLSVGLAYTEGEHNYIVRETVGPNASFHAIFEVCERLVLAMVNLYARTKLADDLIEGRGADYSGS